MQWDDVFADLTTEWEALAAEDTAAEARELARAEQAQIGVRDRLRGSLGSSLRLRLAHGLAVDGELRRVGADFALLASPRQEMLVPLPAVRAVYGLTGRAVTAEQAGAVTTRLGMGSVLRLIAQARRPISVALSDVETLHGTLARVGADYLELAEHPREPGVREEAVRRTSAIPFAAIAVVRRELER